MGKRMAGIFVVLVGLILISPMLRSQHKPVSQTTPAGPAPIKSAAAVQPAGAAAVKPTMVGTPDVPPSRLFATYKEMQVPSGLRVMVFTPHPDDEAIAAGGLIQRVLAKDGKARVVYITNGDGFKEGAMYEFGRAHVSTEDFLEYGEQRHNEALQALSALGLEPSDGVFLGFPDGGIDDLWAEHWSLHQPYTSPTTRFDRPPYAECPSKKIKYAGVNLEEEIIRTLSDFKPDWVVIPDPRDYHPDHYTSGLFVLDALRKMNRRNEDLLGHTKVFTYLVHFKGYPDTPRLWVKKIETAGIGGSEAASSQLAATQWISFPMTSEELDGKERALMAHKSQARMMGGFFKLFSHPYEIFGKLDVSQIMVVPQEYAVRLKRPNT